METTRFAFCMLLVSLVGLTNGLKETLQHLSLRMFVTPVNCTGNGLISGNGLCDSRPCMNGGECVDMGSNYLCYCPEYVYGNNCENVQHQCDGTCKNGGTCSATGMTDYICQCPPNVGGDQCQYAPCLDNPCLNGGTCYAVDQQDYYCSCPAYYGGRNCEES
ncbi:delta-like protein D [Patiria miniata]|uniref:EGF-like domain-containing protein n=1 Tax=Patiria miniata TaxID=46514 RepID=A0A914AN64_PATMI|nr:delta-like protein D [Patiria miniata]